MITADCQNNHTYNLSTDSTFEQSQLQLLGLISQYPRDDDSENAERETQELFPEMQAQLGNAKQGKPK